MTSNAQAKLNYIAGTKTAIGDAIEAKGVSLGASTFREYADKVGEIPSPKDYVLREYTDSDTWTKPAGLKELFVVCIGGGAGGGSGSRGADGVLRRGGGGGGGTVIVWRKISAAELGATETVTIGGGGAGGAAVTADNTNGNDGMAGGDTSFGTFVVAKGGPQGKAGINGSSSSNSSVILQPTSCSPPQSWFVYILGTGTGSSFTGENGTHADTSFFRIIDNYLVASPAGGGKSTANGTGIGGNGSRLYKINNTQSSQRTGGTANNPGDSGLDNQGLQLLMQYNTTAIPTKGLGTSGAGGGAGDNTPTAAGAGGNGGLYGGSGGGGGASLNGANSGKGGDGAGGLCLVYEQY